MEKAASRPNVSTLPICPDPVKRKPSLAKIELNSFKLGSAGPQDEAKSRFVSVIPGWTA